MVRDVRDRGALRTLGVGSRAAPISRAPGARSGQSDLTSPGDSLMVLDVAGGMQAFAFVPPEMPTTTLALRENVREFLRVELAAMTPLDKARSWMGFDAAFSRKLGARGWIGMTWPKKYGGHELGA